MAITVIPTPPLRSQGKTQDQYSAELEATLVALPLMAQDFNQAASDFQLAVTGTSTTSVVIGTGSKSFTTQTGLGFKVAMTLRIGNSSTAYMTGEVTSYNSGTGALVMNIPSGGAVGSGTFASWTISLAAVGASTAGTVSFTPAGNISAINVQTAIQELDTEKLSSAAGAVTGTNLEDIITAGSVGSASNIPVVSYDANGRITSTSSSAKISIGTPNTTTGGTSVDFTGILSTAKRITIAFAGLSTSGTSDYLFQIGDGAIVTTAYLGSGTVTTSTSTSTLYTTGFGIPFSAATAVAHGKAVFELIDASANTWLCTITGGRSDIAATFVAGGTRSLSGALDRIRFTTLGGTNTVDAIKMTMIVE